MTEVLPLGDGWTTPPRFPLPRFVGGARRRLEVSGQVVLDVFVAQATPGGAGSPIVVIPESLRSATPRSFPVQASSTISVQGDSRPMYVHLGVDGALRTAGEVRPGDYLLVYGISFPPAASVGYGDG